MKAKGKGLDYIITILADRSTGEHFVAPLAPPPPPPVPPLPPSPPSPPIKGKTKLSMNTFEGEQGLTNLTFDAGKMKIPKNFTEIERGVYIEKKAVTNYDYKAFLDYINQDVYFSKKYAKSMIPENWGNVKNMKNPVIYVSFEQGLEFCKWKSEVFTYRVLNQKIVDYASILKENDKLRKKYRFRLPTENEWALIVDKGFNHKIGFSCVLDLT